MNASVHGDGEAGPSVRPVRVVAAPSAAGAASVFSTETWAPSGLTSRTGAKPVTACGAPGSYDQLLPFAPRLPQKADRGSGPAPVTHTGVTGSACGGKARS